MKKVIISLVTTSIFLTAGNEIYLLEKDSNAFWGCNASFVKERFENEFLICFNAKYNLNLTNTSIDKEDKAGSRKYLRESEKFIKILELKYPYEFTDESIKEDAMLSSDEYMHKNAHRVGTKMIRKDYETAKMYYNDTFK